MIWTGSTVLSVFVAALPTKIVCKGLVTRCLLVLFLQCKRKIVIGSKLPSTLVYSSANALFDIFGKMILVLKTVEDSGKIRTQVQHWQIKLCVLVHLLSMFHFPYLSILSILWVNFKPTVGDSNRSWSITCKLLKIHVCKINNASSILICHISTILFFTCMWSHSTISIRYPHVCEWGVTN